jgi:hypothetical protein
MSHPCARMYYHHVLDMRPVYDLFWPQQQDTVCVSRTTLWLEAASDVAACCVSPFCVLTLRVADKADTAEAGSTCPAPPALVLPRHELIAMSLPGTRLLDLCHMSHPLAAIHARPTPQSYPTEQAHQLVWLQSGFCRGCWLH